MLVSVVVPTFRRDALLDDCLAALAAQDFDPEGYEVLVADDAPSPATEALVRGWSRQTDRTIRYVAVTRAHGPAVARNEGWRQARGSIIAFTDDDCIPDPSWLKRGIAAFRPGVVAVTGRVMVPISGRPSDYERDAAGLENGDFVTANCLVRRAALEESGGFDERFSLAWREDSDLHFTLLRRGGRIVREPSALVVHPVRPAPWGVSLKQQRKSLFNALLYKKHPDFYRQYIRRGPPWDYYAAVAALAVAVGAAATSEVPLLVVALGVWMTLTVRFCDRRLRGTSRDPGHVLEMLVTSALIPPLSVFWRLYGAFKFRVLFL